MKKISEKRAREILEGGGYLKCRVSRELFETVDSIQKLEDLKILSTVQMFDLYEVSSEYSLPDNAIEVSFDDAFDLVSSKYIINCIKEEDEPFEISSTHQLIDTIRRAQIRRERLVLYWLI